MCNRKFQKKKNTKKFKKLKQYHYCLISSQNRLEEAEKERIKIIVWFRSCSMRNRKFQKNNKIIQKIKKYHYEFISSQNRLEKDEKERNKNYRSIPFRSYPIRNRKFLKNSKKFKKKKKRNMIMVHFKPK